MELLTAILISGSVLGGLFLMGYLISKAENKRLQKDELAEKYGKSTMTHNMLKEEKNNG